LRVIFSAMNQSNGNGKLDHDHDRIEILTNVVNRIEEKVDQLLNFSGALSNEIIKHIEQNRERDQKIKQLEQMVNVVCTRLSELE